MILPVHDRLRAHVAQLMAALYALDAASAPTIVLEYPPNRDLGDLGTPVAFELARRLRKAPRAIAQEIAGAFGSIDGIRQVRGYAQWLLETFLSKRHRALSGGDLFPLMRSNLLHLRVHSCKCALSYAENSLNIPDSYGSRTTPYYARANFHSIVALRLLCSCGHPPIYRRGYL